MRGFLAFLSLLIMITNAKEVMAGPIGASDFSLAALPLVEVKGIKYPNSPEEGDQAVVFYANSARASDLQGFNSLLPYLLRSPNQNEAGSCLYMATTGNAEWWLAKLASNPSLDPDGPIDLSERYLMNLATVFHEFYGTTNWKTDTIYLFNQNNNHGVLNKFYPFTKGYYTTDAQEEILPSEEGAPGVQYGTYYNWIDETAKIKDGFIELPEFQRRVIFKDPEGDQWNMGMAPANIVDLVKDALTNKKAPVQIIYNHFAYWHAVLIVGYDDEMPTQQCKFVEAARKYFPDQVIEYQKKLAQAANEEEKKIFEKRILRMKTMSNKLESAYAQGGGCAAKGMFYVRDSIYADPEGPVYDYDKSKTGDEEPYSRLIVLHEYEWLKYMANHVIQISVVR